MFSTKIKGIVYALVSATSFGLIPLFSIPLLFDYGLDKSSILFYRYLFSSLSLGLLCVLTKRSLRLTGSLVVQVGYLSLMYAATAFLLLYSYQFLPSGMATTIHFLYPLVVLLLMRWLYQEKLSVRLLGLGLMALVGVALLSHNELLSSHWLGMLVAGSTAITYALYIVGIQANKQSMPDSLVLSFYVLAFGTVYFGIYSLIVTPLQGIPSWEAAGYLLGLSQLSTVLSLLTLVLGVRYAGASLSSILGAAEPITATLVGIWVFAEYYTWLTVFGVVLILFSISFLLYSRK